MKKKTLLLAALGLLLAGAASAQPGEALLGTKGCLACHDMNAVKVGPAFKDVAAKYKTDKKALGRLTAALKEGKGHPVKAEATEAELKAMVTHVLAAQAPAAAKAPEPAAAVLDNATCLGCHGNEGFSMPGPDGKPRALHVVPEKFALSVHAKRQCVECHRDITEIPHQKVAQRKVSCVQCHEALWASAQKENKTSEHVRLGVVVEQINRYMHSIHARPNRDDQSRTNATCYNCHEPHYVYPKDSAARTEWRLSIPDACGKCHAKQRAAYATSVHGKEVLENRNLYAAVCSDCHTTHDIDTPEGDTVRVAITRNCGTCHTESLRTYTETYHGQVNTLGYAHTAKCFDCHGSHTVQRVKDPASRVHPDNRLGTCQRCHAGATAGFATFEPHATSHDFGRYPYVWIATKFMVALLVGVFAVLLDAYRAVVLPRVPGPPGAQAAAPRRRRGAVAAAGQAVPALRAGLAPRPPGVRIERHDAGADRHGGVLRRQRMGQGRHRRLRRPEDRGHRAPYCGGDHAGHLLRAPDLPHAAHRAKLADLGLVRPGFAGAQLAGPEGRHRHVQVVLRPRPAADVRPLDLLGEVRLLGACSGAWRSSAAAA